ncbi:MAG: endonuclease/exonuclease/phosphatase family protein [Tannerellaceae bacterium]|nr:endonuclease/exonuclease/phosphatase family protein [Tannerellaceae bacterium]
MKKMFTTAVCLFMCCVFAHAQELTVASYNIRNENPGDAERGNGWKQRCPVICNQVQFYDFDLFGAQEVLHGQVDDMLAGLPEYAYTGVGRDDGKTGGEYVPIFYKKEKFELLRSGHFWLSETTDTPNKGWDAALPRICTWGLFDMQGRTFWCFNLHMDHIGVKARSESAKLVLSKIREMCGNDPAILMGDFNVDQRNESYALLQASDILDDTYEKAHIRYALNGTFNGFDPDVKTDDRIDHIFVTASFEAVRYGILTDTYRSPSGGKARTPSDHFPVMVKLRLLK